LVKPYSLENIKEYAKKGLVVLGGFANALKVKFAEVEVGIDYTAGAADSGDLELDLPELLVTVAKAAEAGGTPVAIMIDEMQYLSEIELSALIMAIHQAAQQNLPLVLVGAGLPQLVGLTGKSKSYAERLFDFPLVGPLSDNDARNAVQGPAQREGAIFEDAALQAILDVTEGYPYFLQRVGVSFMEQSSRVPITLTSVNTAHEPAVNNLDQSFFRVRFDRLTPREKDYLRAMAELGPGPHRSGDIAAIEGVKVDSVTPLRNGLIKKGMI
jgi:hypothetical protein